MLLFKKAFCGIIHLFVGADPEDGVTSARIGHGSVTRARDAYMTEEE